MSSHDLSKCAPVAHAPHCVDAKIGMTAVKAVGVGALTAGAGICGYYASNEFLSADDNKKFGGLIMLATASVGAGVGAGVAAANEGRRPEDCAVRGLWCVAATLAGASTGGFLTDLILTAANIPLTPEQQAQYLALAASGSAGVGAAAAVVAADMLTWKLGGMNYLNVGQSNPNYHPN